MYSRTLYSFFKVPPPSWATAKNIPCIGSKRKRLINRNFVKCPFFGILLWSVVHLGAHG